MPSKSKNAKTKKKSTAHLTGSVEAAIKVMTLAMADPLSDYVCAIRIGEASLRIDAELASFKSILDKSKFARSYPELLRVGMRFLTTKHQPGTEYQTFIQNMTQCTHNCSISRVDSTPGRVGVEHDRCMLASESESSWLYYGAINTICTLIELSLLDITRHKFHTSHAGSVAAGINEPGIGHRLEDSSAGSGIHSQEVSVLGAAGSASQQKWPSGPDDLLPFGVEDSAFALNLWGRSPPFAAGIFRLVGALASFYAPFSIYIIGPAEPNPLFDAYPIRFIKHIIEDYSRISSRTSRRPVPLDSISHHFAYSLSAVFGLYAYMQRCEMVFPHVVGFYTGRKLSRYFERISEILDNPAISRCMQDIEQVKATVQRMYIYSASDDFCKSQLPANATLQHADMTYRERMTILVEGIGVDRIFDTLQATRKSGCSNVDCPLPEASAVHAMLCSKCDLVRFCSRDCLKAAWNSEHYPHKKICIKIHDLKAILGEETWSSIWSASPFDPTVLAEKKFEQACKPKGIDINDVEGTIARHLRYLQKRIYFKYVLQKMLSPEHRRNLLPGSATERYLAQMREDMERTDTIGYRVWNTM